jgi:hypothetical protein
MRPLPYILLPITNPSHPLALSAQRPGNSLVSEAVHKSKDDCEVEWDAVLTAFLHQQRDQLYVYVVLLHCILAPVRRKRERTKEERNKRRSSMDAATGLSRQQMTRKMTTHSRRQLPGYSHSTSGTWDQAHCFNNVVGQRHEQGDY